MRWPVGAAAAAVLALALPATAQEPRPTTVQPKPKSGGARTTFTVRYDAIGQEGFGGDQLYVRGPRGTRCAGEVIHGAVGHEGGIQTIAMGPRLDEGGLGPRYRFVPRDPDTEKRLRTWCRGEYRGWVQWEDDDGEVDKHTRFRFRVR
jgi:hypothetical protein